MALAGKNVIVSRVRLRKKHTVFSGAANYVHRLAKNMGRMTVPTVQYTSAKKKTYNTSQAITRDGDAMARSADVANVTKKPVQSPHASLN